jgi:hypothetical protein
MQQHQIQHMMHQTSSPPQPSPMDPQPFYIAHDPQMNMGAPTQRRTWGQPQPINFAHQMDPNPSGWMSPRRQQQQQQQQQWNMPQRYGLKTQILL